MSTSVFIPSVITSLDRHFFVLIYQLRDEERVERGRDGEVRELNKKTQPSDPTRPHADATQKPRDPAYNANIELIGSICAVVGFPWYQHTFETTVAELVAEIFVTLVEPVWSVAVLYTLNEVCIIPVHIYNNKIHSDKMIKCSLGCQCK